MKSANRNSPPPAGTYYMTLNYIKEEARRWHFNFQVCEEGEYLECELTHITSTEVDVDNALRNFLGQLYGRALLSSEKVDLNELIDTWYLVEVEERTLSKSDVGNTHYIKYLERLNDDGDLCSEVFNELFYED